MTKEFRVRDGYIYNPLITIWTEESRLGGSSDYIRDLKVNLFQRFGEHFWTVGSASKHLINLAYDNPENKGDQQERKPSLLYWGNLTIYQNNIPILSGAQILQAIPFNSGRIIPFLDLLFKNERRNGRDIDEIAKLVIERYNESLEYADRLREVRRIKTELEDKF